MSTLQALTFTTLVFVVRITLVSTAWPNKTRRYLPGPSPEFIIGNLLDFPSSDAAREYARWRQKFKSTSPLFLRPYPFEFYPPPSQVGYYTHLNLGNTYLSPTREIRQKNCSKGVRPTTQIDQIFRPLKCKQGQRLTQVLKIFAYRIGCENNVVLLPYGTIGAFIEIFSTRTSHQSAGSRTIHSYVRGYTRRSRNSFWRPRNLKRTVNCKKINLYSIATEILTSEHRHYNHRLSISIPMSIMYGYNVQNIHDPCIVAAEKTITIGAEFLLPGASLKNVFHALKYILMWFLGAVA